tara:strand:- start:659 stop:1570 length:912 start_codon:yes stop_codon:yes gene_type:complete
MNFSTKKINDLFSCPNCKSALLKKNNNKINCKECGDTFDILFNTPVFIKNNSPVLEWYNFNKDSKLSTKKDFKRLLKYIYRKIKPVERIWTTKSKRAIQNLIEKLNPDINDNNVVLIGSGFEPVYRRILNPYKNIIYMGLSNRGSVDIINDICNIPLLDEKIDLVLSSSVLEHVYNPEIAVQEMHRVIKPGGYVYAEIPFMRSYHMIPIDYQRYTISGIEELFKRNGFKLVEKGICSGPFTAIVLFLIDFCSTLFKFNNYLSAIIGLILSLILHPFKYLDRLFESSNWAEVCACNFYYIGKKL